jgi:hypothetical protein
MSHRSAKWLQGYLYGLEAHSLTGRAAHIKQVRAELAEAEAREASEPTAADLAVADELDMLAAHIQEYIGPDDARDDIRRICRNRAQDLRRGVKRAPTAAEVIKAAEKALEGVVTFPWDEKCKSALAFITKWKEAHNA